MNPKTERFLLNVLCFFIIPRLVMECYLSGTIVEVQFFHLLPITIIDFMVGNYVLFRCLKRSFESIFNDRATSLATIFLANQFFAIAMMYHALEDYVEHTLVNFDVHNQQCCFRSILLVNYGYIINIHSI